MQLRRICAVIVLFLWVSIPLKAQKQGGPECIVVSLAKASTAEKMGLKSGDIILSINGKEIHNKESLSKQINSFRGSEIEIKVLRKDKEITFKSVFNTDKLGIGLFFYERDRLLSPQEMKEDLDTLFSAICEIHPNPYSNISKQEYEILKTEVYKKIKDSLSINDFWKPTAPIVAKLGDGHTHLDMPDGE